MKQLSLFDTQDVVENPSFCDDEEGIVAVMEPAFVLDASAVATEELLRRIEERRMARLADVDLSILPAEALPAKEEEPEEEPAKEKLFAEVKAKIKAFFACAPAWFDARVTKKSNRKTPVSAFVGIGVLAVCLSLIVGGSILVTHGENVNNRLKREISQITAEIEDLQSTIHLQNDVLLIRELAENECGMIGEEYVRSDTISMDRGESVETYPDGKPEGVGLAALLSAIGIKK